MSKHVVAGFRAVRIIAERPDPTRAMAVGEIAHRLGMTLSAGSRLCAELDQLGLLERADGYGTYRLGPEAIQLSGHAAAPVSQSVRSALTLAAQRTGETALLAIPTAEGMRVVAAIDSSWTLFSPAAISELIVDQASAIARAATGTAENTDGTQPFESTVGAGVEIAAPVLNAWGECVAVVAVRLPVNRAKEGIGRARRAISAARRTIEHACAPRGDGTRSPVGRTRTEPGAGVGDEADQQDDGAEDAGVREAPASRSALAAALDIVRHLAAGANSVSGIARAVGLRPDRTQRLIESCRQSGIVETLHEPQLFRLSWAMHGWYRAAVTSTIVERGQPLVSEVARNNGICAFITVLRGMRSVTVVEELEQVEPGLRMTPWLGRPCPILAADGGPSLVMDFSTDDLRQLFPRRQNAHELEVFLRYTRRVARDGVVTKVAFEEAGLISISAPVRDASSGVTAAACIVGIADAVRPNIARLERVAKELATRVSKLIGGPAAD